MESILEVLTPDNLIFIFKGFGLTLYISHNRKYRPDKGREDNGNQRNVEG